MYLCRLKMESQINKMMFFSETLKSILKFHYQNRRYIYVFFFFSVHRTVFSQCIKVHKIICHNLSWHCNVPSLYPSFSPYKADCTAISVCCWVMGVCLGLTQATQWGRTDRGTTLQPVLGCIRPTGCGLDSWTCLNYTIITGSGVLAKLQSE